LPYTDYRQDVDYNRYQTGGGNNMGWGTVGLIAYQMYQDRKNRQLQQQLSQPMPTHLRYAWNPMQRQMYNWMSPYIAGMYGQPGAAPSAGQMAGQTDIGAFEGRQYGGPVDDMPKQPYLVGETGPELFVPEQDGQIVPMQQTTPGMSPWEMMPPGQLPSRQAGGPVNEGGQNLLPGQMPTAQPWQMQAPTMPGAAPTPTAGWYGALDPNVRAGIEEPYQRGMKMLEERMQGRGVLGAQRAGMSGAAADVLGQYMQQAAPSMAMTGWGMMAPGQLAQAQAGWGMQAQQQGAQQQANLLAQQQQWQGQMMPYQMLPQMLPYMMPEGITSTGPITFPGDPAAPAPQLPPVDPAYLAWQKKQESLMAPGW